MITYVVCDLFASPAQTLVNTVNTVGVMGKGIAKDLKQSTLRCLPEPGTLRERAVQNRPAVALSDIQQAHPELPHQEHWRSPSRPEYIEAGLKTFAEKYHLYGVTSRPSHSWVAAMANWIGNCRCVPSWKGTWASSLWTSTFTCKTGQDPYTPEHRDEDRQMKKWLRGEPESLAFNEVWAYLIAAVASDSDCVAIGTGENFRVRDWRRRRFDNP